jgi:hypothetical protein
VRHFVTHKVAMRRMSHEMKAEIPLKIAFHVTETLLHLNKLILSRSIAPGDDFPHLAVWYGVEVFFELLAR